MLRKGIKLYPYHSFLAIPFIVLFLFAQNTEQTKAFMIYRTLYLGFAGTILLFVLFYALLRNRLKTGVLVTCLIFFLFQYGVIYEFFESLYYKGLWPLKNIHRYLIVFYGLCTLFLFWFFIRSKHDFIKINYFLNFLILLLLLFNGFRVLFPGTKTLIGKEGHLHNPHATPLTFEKKDSLPNVYFIILDGYASNSVLQKYFQYNNSAFTDQLHQLGFNIYDSAFANYYYTSNSLSSTLNMHYADSISDLNSCLRENLVFKTFKHNGYHLSHMKSGYAVTSSFAETDETIYIDGPNEFEKSLLKYTILRLDDLVGLFAHKRLKSQFVKMYDFLNTTTQPKFCFLHFVAPHPPYIFDRDGNLRTKHQFAENSWEPKDYYVDQLVYVNKEIGKFLNTIVTKDPNALIILQSDHGPWTKAPKREEVFEARSKILYAVYSRKNLSIPAHTSSVNTFRYVMNGVFACKLPLLRDIPVGKTSLLSDPILTKKADH